MTTATQQANLTELDALLDQWEALGAQIAKLNLPDFDPATKCCDDPELRHVEDGYARQTTVTNEDGVLVAQTDGWDDYSEDGQFQFLACLSCGARWNTPTSLEWN